MELDAAWESVNWFLDAVWDAWVIKRTALARACVEGRLARPELLVETSVVAALKE